MDKNNEGKENQSDEAILEIIASTENFETVGAVFIQMIEDSIKSIQNGYIDSMETMHSYYIVLLEKSVESGIKLVDTSIDGVYKKICREQYMEHQIEIAKKQSLIHRVERIIEQRRNQG